MTDRSMPVSGPYRIYVDATPTGAKLDVSAFLEAFVLELVREHGEELTELIDLDQSAQHQLSHGDTDSRSGHERDARVQELIEDVGCQLPVYGSQVAALADALYAVARPKSLPGQRGAA